MTAEPAQDAEARAVDDYARAVTALERELAASYTSGRRLARDVFERLARDLRQATRRADRAERRLARAQARVAELEAELEAVRRSATWRAGRVVVAAPARARRLLGRGRPD